MLEKHSQSDSLTSEVYMVNGKAIPISREEKIIDLIVEHSNKGYSTEKLLEEIRMYFGGMWSIKSKCEYCGKGANTNLISNGNEGIYIDGNGNLTGDDKFALNNKKLNYCPICGKKLKV